MTLDEMKELLRSDGWKIYQKSNLKNEKWYACKQFDSIHWCESNHKRPQFVLWAYENSYAGEKYHSCKVDVTGEADGAWFELSAYSMLPAEFWNRRQYIMGQLKAAWEAL